MAVELLEIVTDDVLDKPLTGEAKRNVPFMWDGVETTLDVAPGIYEAFAALTKKDGDDKPAPDGSLLRDALVVTVARPRVSSERSERTAAIRAWAKTQKNADGTDKYDVKDRGAIPANVEEAYDAAMAAAKKS
jgi:hypothetical protein